VLTGIEQFLQIAITQAVNGKLTATKRNRGRAVARRAKVVCEPRQPGY
jgi:hypothetical protein